MKSLTELLGALDQHSATSHLLSSQLGMHGQRADSIIKIEQILYALRALNKRQTVA
ncbi:unannotated protein [freshwater metagenome]|uniref:Unannotated protein n=1 Tax=freshwater metagenome TaxID=449393 RepID=A0A6J7MD41_9ZZZZ